MLVINECEQIIDDGWGSQCTLSSSLAIAASPRCSGREHCLAWMCVSVRQRNDEIIPDVEKSIIDTYVVKSIF